MNIKGNERKQSFTFILTHFKHCLNIAGLTEDKENASQHPDLYSSESFSLGRVGGDIVEDVDQHQEEGDEEGHAPCTHHTVGMGSCMDEKEAYLVQCLGESERKSMKQPQIVQMGGSR